LELIQQLSQKREKVIKVEDLEYFKKRLATASTEAERSRIGKQLEMLEEAVVIHGIRVDIEEQKIL
jgi:radical SAM superfamily enzyme